MFGFLDMIGTYEERKVANDVVNEVTIDTAMVTDSYKPYETGISGKMYNNGDWIIVELYDTKEEAIIGHNKWTELFNSDLPETLTDVNTSEIGKLLKVFKPEVEIHAKNG